MFTLKIVRARSSPMLVSCHNAMWQVFMVVKIQAEVFLVMVLCSMFTLKIVRARSSTMLVSYMAGFHGGEDSSQGLLGYDAV